MDVNLQSSIEEVHRHVVDCAHGIVKHLIDHGDFVYSTGDELMLYASQLFKLLPDVSRPQWLITLLEEFEGRHLSKSRSNNRAAEFVAFILSNYRNIESPLLTPDEVNYNFDVTFDDIRDAQGIPSMFESLVEKLEKIIAADLIDSRVVQEALERLMALLKRNKHGSLTSILVSLHYGRFALKAFGGALGANKYLKPMVEAFKDEFVIAEEKVQMAEAKLKEEAVRRLTNRERLIAYVDQNGGDSTVVAGFLGRSELDANDSE